MFEFFFKYPPAVFAKGRLVFLGSLPVWALAALAALLAGGLGYLLWKRRGGRPGRRSLALWALESALLAWLLLLLGKPAISVSSLKPQQNVVAVVVDDSRSMALEDRKEQVLGVVNSSALKALRDKFQVRLYRLGAHAERLESPPKLTASLPATHLAEGLKQVAAESATLAIGAIVLLSDGADNAGGIDAETAAQLRCGRIPIHTVGFGRERPARDLEMLDVEIPVRALTDSRLPAQVSFRQFGLAGRPARLVVRESGKTLAQETVTLPSDGAVETRQLIFNAGIAGAKNIQATLELVEGEENARNNSLTRVVNVESAKPRILYIEGEPKWEFKFIRRAVEEDRSLNLATLLRTTQNKLYRQGIENPKELEEGFPAKVEELFAFQGVIVGGVEASYFTPAQQELMRQFVDRRGGGLLFLGGRAGLAEGGYANSALADLLPVVLPAKKLTFFREPATAELTPAGRESLICRLEENPDGNVERWKKLPPLADYQESGTPKPGAVVLADGITAGRGRFPLLSIQNYGAGRTALMATAGTWRWQMQQPLADKTHEMFWQQLLRWLVAGPHGRVTATTPKLMLYDEGRLAIHTKVKDTRYAPAADATVEAHILGPEGLSAALNLSPDPLEPGDYTADWSADKPGSYVVEVVARRGADESGRDVFTFRREDGVAEDFRTSQNRELLERLAEQTGGRYYRPGEFERLTREIVYSEAGISVRETKELWDMPAVFLLLLLLAGGEWLLRRKWGVV
ncbi:MAG: hypothetical protein HY822_17210 [Acidobacteria bacterium]|nr:hypothetical protein [Acidobacteriota bacterium]